MSVTRPAQATGGKAYRYRNKARTVLCVAVAIPFLGVGLWLSIAGRAGAWIVGMIPVLIALAPLSLAHTEVVLYPDRDYFAVRNAWRHTKVKWTEVAAIGTTWWHTYLIPINWGVDLHCVTVTLTNGKEILCEGLSGQRCKLDKYVAAMSAELANRKRPVAT